jgi:hypothetical protein
MPKTMQHQRLPEYSDYPAEKVEGGYALKAQNDGTGSGCATVFMIIWSLGWLGISGTMTIIGIATQTWPLAAFAGLFVLVGLGVVYGAMVLPYLVRQRFATPYFAINAWPLTTGNSYGMSFQRRIKRGVVASDGLVQVLISCAEVTRMQFGTETRYNSRVLWQEAFDFSQVAGASAFEAQWLSSLPVGLPPSFDSYNSWLEWQVAVRIISAGLPDHLVQYKLKVEQ